MTKNANEAKNMRSLLYRSDFDSSTLSFMSTYCDKDPQNWKQQLTKRDGVLKKGDNSS